MPENRMPCYSEKEKELVIKELSLLKEKLGSWSHVARALNISPSSVQEWIHMRRPVPILRTLELRQIMDNQIDCGKLRPDYKKLFTDIGLSR